MSTVLNLNVDHQQVEGEALQLEVPLEVSQSGYKNIINEASCKKWDFECLHMRTLMCTVPLLKPSND